MRVRQKMTLDMLMVLSLVTVITMAQEDTPLREAARFLDLSRVQELIDLGAEFDARNASGETPLLCAALLSQNPIIVQQLIEELKELISVPVEQVSTVRPSILHHSRGINRQ